MTIEPALYFYSERPTLKALANTNFEQVKACYPVPTFPQCRQPAVYVEATGILASGMLSTYKFVTLFFFYITSRNPATRKAIYFWFFGVLLNCFLFIMQLLRQELMELVYEVWNMIIVVFDIWPFLLVLQLILDVFGDTGAFTTFEVVACQGLIRLFWIYSLVFPATHVWFSFYHIQSLQRSAFLTPAYIMLGGFVVFFCHVVFRIFVCEKYIASFFIGPKSLVKFQVGAFIVAISLLAKIVFLVWFEIPPVSLEEFSLVVNVEDKLYYSTWFYCVTHGIVYVVPYILVALGANFTRPQSEGENNRTGEAPSESSRSSLRVLLLEE